MNFQKRPSFSARDISILVFIGLAAVILGSIFIGANIAISRVVKGGGGFFVGLEGARAFLFEHTDPYSVTVASLAQEQAYGRTAISGENPYILTLPFYLLPFYFPFALFSESASARGIWMFICEITLISSAFIALRVIDWQPRKLLIIFFYFVSIFNYYSVTAILEGTPVILIGFLYFSFLFAYYHGRDELAGSLLVFTMFFWQVGSLFLILAIWKIFTDKRWRVFFGFGMTFVILFALSLLIYPGWIFSFIIASFMTLRSQFGITSAEIFARLSPDYGHLISQAATFLFVGMLIYEWIMARRADLRRFVWAASLTLAVTPLIGFRTEISNLVLIFPCLTMIFAVTSDRWKTGWFLSILLLAIVFLVPWAFYVQGLAYHDQRYQDYLFLFYPVFTILGLYWIRWWFIRPPRTLLDQLRAPG